MSMLPRGYLTGLEERRYSAAYLKRLSVALSAFRRWLAERGPHGIQLTPQHAASLDGALSIFVDFCFEERLGFDLAKHALLAVQRLLHLRGRLPRAWNC